MNAYVRLISRVSQALGVLSMGLMACAVAVVCQMIVVRYFLGGSTIWQTEFTQYALVAATFLASPYVLMHRGHVGVDLLPMALPPGPRRWLQLVGGGLSLLFCVALGWAAWIHFHEALVGGWRTETVWAIPLWMPLAPMVVGLVLLCLQWIAEMMIVAGVAEPVVHSAEPVA